MWKFIVAMILMLGLFTVCGLKLCSNFNKGMNEGKKYHTEIKARLGTKVVINKVTLTITDYSLIHDNYTLSNGTKLSFEYFK